MIERNKKFLPTRRVLKLAQKIPGNGVLGTKRKQEQGRMPASIENKNKFRSQGSKVTDLCDVTDLSKRDGEIPMPTNMEHIIQPVIRQRLCFDLIQVS